MRNAWRTCAVCLYALLIGACSSVSLKQVDHFGTSALKFSEASQKAFALYEDASVQYKLDYMATTPRTEADLRIFEGFISYSPQATNAIGVRLKRLELIEAYAVTLKTLATTDPKESIDKSSTKLNSSLTTISKNSGNSDPEVQKQIGLVSTAVRTSYTEFAAHKRRQAIKDLVIAMHPSVIAACQDMVQRFSVPLTGPSPSIPAFVSAQLDLRQQYLLQEYNRVRELPTTTFERRRALLSNLNAVYLARVAAPQFFMSLREVAEKAESAQLALRSAVLKDEFSTSELVENLIQLQDKLDDAEKFYHSLVPASGG
ncbi:hypothetical protein M0765_026540 [Variovorax sp. S2]|uniref:hypothetical protein n=1 Tax=Variovorax sp. S12S4 TaxID=3029170 RepID=UPI00215C6F55|nr:hypothetical protein [Variovorax sp. S12S4]MCR8961158.1 hypothetical protein [Variovorax sp. S12S4]